MYAGSYVSTATYLNAGSFVQATGYVSSASTIMSGLGLVSNTGQIRVNALKNYTFAAGSNPVYNIDLSLSQAYNIQITTSGINQSLTLNAINYTLPGAVVYLFITGGADNFGLTFGTFFEKYSGGFATPPAAGAFGANGEKKWVFCFVCDGTNIFEVSRNTLL
jgi:hypothetical protein